MGTLFAYAYWPLYPIRFYVYEFWHEEPRTRVAVAVAFSHILRSQVLLTYSADCLLCLLFCNTYRSAEVSIFFSCYMSILILLCFLLTFRSGGIVSVARVWDRAKLFVGGNFMRII